MRSERGQATVELVALLPVVLVVAMVLLCVLAAGRARELSGAAAQAGAMALLRDADPRAAARDVTPARHRRGLRVRVRGRRVIVELVPDVPLPGVGKRLAASSTADAGPEPQR